MQRCVSNFVFNDNSERKEAISSIKSYLFREPMWTRAIQSKNTDVLLNILRLHPSFDAIFVSKSDPYSETTLAWAAKNNLEEVVERLLPRVNPAARNAGHDSAIFVASLKGHTEVVRLLLADDLVNPSGHHNGPIILASRFGRTEVVGLLLADGRADPSAEDNAAIRTESAFGRTRVVELLLADNRVNSSAQDNDAIRLASQNGHAEVVELLLAEDPNRRDIIIE
jgi:ankyrin repeat protein